MTKLAWDPVGSRLYETGVDRGVLYIPDVLGAYVNGVAWNGLTTITETPSGASPTAQYADNIKYLNMISAETFDAQIDAFTYPDEFSQFDGIQTPTGATGIQVAQQSRKTFGLCYRTKLGNDIAGDDYAYKIHIIYGCTAAPSQKAYTTINDAPAAMPFSWAISTSPVAVNNLKPTALLTIDSSKVTAASLAALELILYGSVGVNPALPTPDAIVTLFSGTITTVALLNPPTFVPTTGVITVVATAGITYYNSTTGLPLVTGANPAIPSLSTVVVRGRPNAGFIIAAGADDDFSFTRTT